ncbi:MAG: AMP-binding protein [Candidatus Binatia bacterium]
MSGTLQSLASSLITRGDRPALLEFRQDDFQQWSYYQIAIMARDLASGLSEAGVKQHDRVMLLGSNRSDWIIAASLSSPLEPFRSRQISTWPTKN